MKQIVVMSGKGGTGKTTITAALAELAGPDAVLADCDVDASNLHLLLRPDILSEARFMGHMLPVFDARQCTMCGMCVMACAWNAISAHHGQLVVDPQACEGCGICSHVCPDGYITMVPHETGRLFTSRSRFGQPMLHARLGIGQENSGKLVTEVRKSAVAAAERENKPFVLIDGPPGIGCPAIAAVTGATVVLLVTESTKAGLHDLNRLLTLIGHFGIPAACIINKADLDEETRDRIRQRCDHEGIPILAELPWMDVFPESLRQGSTLCEMQDAALNVKIEDIWSYFNINGGKS